MGTQGVQEGHFVVPLVILMAPRILTMVGREVGMHETWKTSWT